MFQKMHAVLSYQFSGKIKHPKSSPSSGLNFFNNFGHFYKILFQDTIESDCNLVVAELNVDFFNFWNLWNSTFYFDNRSKISHCPSQHRELILLRHSYVTQ